MPKTKTKDPFTYKQHPFFKEGQAFEVSYREPDEEESYDEQLGVVQYYERKKGEAGWCFQKLGHPQDFDINTPDNIRYRPVFESKEQAAHALLIVHRAISANPLTDELRHYMKDRSRNLEEERRHLTSRFVQLRFEMLLLQRLAEKHGLKHFEFGVDTHKEVSDLKEFLDKHMEEIYEHFGKEWARSLRAYIRSVVDLIDPETGIEI